VPYQSNEDLPMTVQAHLPPHPQDIYREAFNHAFASHAGDARQEEAAHSMGGCQAVVCEGWRQLGWMCCARLSISLTADAVLLMQPQGALPEFTDATPMP
jgi:cation transport regulator ChaB